MMSARDIMKLVEKQRPYFGTEGGLTISGGEPTLQAKALTPLFALAQKAGIHTALDTNGGIVDEEVKKLYALTDLVILDVKHIDDEAHTLLTGKSNEHTLSMAEYREQQGKPMWLRYVMVPGYNDSDDILHRWGQSLRHYKTVERVELLPYHTLGAYKFKELGWKNPLAGVKPPDTTSVQRARVILESYFSTVVVH